MNILILGASGFIGTNLAIKLAENKDNKITVVGKNIEHFSAIAKLKFTNIVIRISSLNNEIFTFLESQDVVYHLMSTNTPSTSNQHISSDIEANVIFSSNLFEACVKYNVKKVVFISSGGTVYGKESKCPLPENTPTNPITSYGVQKITIEKLLYLYNYMYGLDYRIIRLANPYGPYQRPDGILGAVTTFTYRALTGKEIKIYGDGSVVRDYIYIDDAIRAILNIANGESDFHVFNVGCGYGTQLKDVLKTIKSVLDVEINIVYLPTRDVDVPINYLDISRYERCYGKLNPISLGDGIKKTAEFMKRELI